MTPLLIALSEPKGDGRPQLIKLLARSSSLESSDPDGKTLRRHLLETPLPQAQAISGGLPNREQR